MTNSQLYLEISSLILGQNSLIAIEKKWRFLENRIGIVLHSPQPKIFNSLNQSNGGSR
jgi:hypothetical protein